MAVASLIISILAFCATGTAATVAIVQARTAKVQSKTALDGLALQREASLVVRVSSFYNGSVQWRVENQGRAHARGVYAYLSFDPDQREFGRLSLGDIAPDASKALSPTKPIGHPLDYSAVGPGKRIKAPYVTLEWRNIDEVKRSARVSPGIDPGLKDKREAKG